MYKYLAFFLEWPVPGIEVKSLEQSIRCYKGRRYLEESQLYEEEGERVVFAFLYKLRFDKSAIYTSDKNKLY